MFTTLSTVSLYKMNSRIASLNILLYFWNILYIQRLYINSLYSLVGSPRTWSGNRRRINTSSCARPSVDQRCARPEQRTGRQTAPPASRPWCLWDAAPASPSPCTRWWWSPGFRSSDSCRCCGRTSARFSICDRPRFHIVRLRRWRRNRLRPSQLPTIDRSGRVWKWPIYGAGHCLRCLSCFGARSWQFSCCRIHCIVNCHLKNNCTTGWNYFNTLNLCIIINII